MATDFFRPGIEKGLVDYGVPSHLHEGLVQYCLEGRPVGGFLSYCLENNFAEALVRAGGDLNIDDLRSIAKWLWNEAPKRSWGSPQAVQSWKGM